MLFSIEVTASSYSIGHLWKAMFTSVAGALVFRVKRDRDKVQGSLKLFQLTEFSTQDLGVLLYNGEMGAFALLGVLCGLIGAAFVHVTAANVRLVRQIRKVVDKGDGGMGGGSGSSSVEERYGCVSLVATPWAG